MIRVLLVSIVAAVAAAGAVALPAPAAAAGALIAVFIVAAVARQWSRSDTATLRTTVDRETSTEVPPWLESISTGLLLLDDELAVVFANQAAASLLGRGREAMVGVTLIRATREHNLVQVAREAAAVPREVDLRDHKIVRATATRLPVTSAGVRLVIALEDLTDLRRAQRARSDLVANASHELRTPVAAAMALAETLDEGVDDEQRRADFHQRLTEELARLNGVVEGLLHLSRLESRTDDFNIESVPPDDLIDTAARRIEPLLRAGQRIVTVSQAGTPVATDRERTLEVLANLLDNALRVTPERGAVTISAIDGDGEVRFEVRDEGPGILPQDRERVFERFYTGDQSRTASRNSGLGLAIARHIIARLGGRIWVDERTPGATLCFTLPAVEGSDTTVT